MVSVAVELIVVLLVVLLLLLLAILVARSEPLGVPSWGFLAPVVLAGGLPGCCCLGLALPLMSGWSAAVPFCSGGDRKSVV